MPPNERVYDEWCLGYLINVTHEYTHLPLSCHQEIKDH